MTFSGWPFFAFTGLCLAVAAILVPSLLVRRRRLAAVLASAYSASMAMSVLLPWYAVGPPEGSSVDFFGEFGAHADSWNGLQVDFFGPYTMALGVCATVLVSLGARTRVRRARRSVFVEGTASVDSDVSARRKRLALASALSLTFACALTTADLVWHGRTRTMYEVYPVGKEYGIYLTLLLSIGGAVAAWTQFRRT